MPNEVRAVARRPYWHRSWHQRAAVKIKLPLIAESPEHPCVPSSSSSIEWVDNVSTYTKLSRLQNVYNKYSSVSYFLIIILSQFEVEFQLL